MKASDIKKKCILSICITSIFTLINLILAKLTNLFLGIKFSGGEVDTYIGFGIIKNKFYPILNSTDIKTKEIEVYFEPFTYIISLIVVFFIILLAAKIIDKKKQKIMKNIKSNNTDDNL